MDGYTILMCKYGECSYVLRFHHSKSFADLISELKMTCGFDDGVQIRVYYSILEHSKCMLRNDNELEYMIEVVRDLEKKCIDLVVEVENSVTCSSTLTSGEKRGMELIVGSGTCVNTSLENITPSYHASSSRSTALRSGEIQGMEVLVGNDTCVYTGLEDTILPYHASSSRSLLCSSTSNLMGNLMSSSWSTAITHVGQVFEGGVVHFRDALCKFSLALGFQFSYQRNNRQKVHAICKDNVKGCNWSIIASVSPVSGHFFVKSFVNEHTCSTVIDGNGARRLTSSRISSLILNQIKAKPGFVGKEVENHPHSNFGFQVPYRRAWRALEEARGKILGDHVKSFSLLREHMLSVQATNPGSHLVLDVDDESRRFRRAFISFAASIHGFKFIRPMLFLDGTFLKGRSKGVVLAAVGKDGDQGLYPLAFAVVDSESEDNWRWFLIELRKIIDNDRVINFISDHNIGLLEALPKVFPSCYHFFCLRHLKANLRDKFVGRAYSADLKDHIVWLFGECAKAPTIPLFTEKLAQLKESGGKVVEQFLRDLPLESWTNAYSKGCRYGEMTSNAVESFNAWIVDIRELPITSMLDSLRTKLMKWFAERRKLAAQWNGFVCPDMLDKINNSIKEGRTWYVRNSSSTIYEVLSSPSVMVNVSQRLCSCRRWQIDGFPCVHACVAISRSSLSIEEVVENYFHVHYYRNSYEGLIYPVPSTPICTEGTLDEVDILPPLSKKQPGRPQKRRYKSRVEHVRPLMCGRCGKFGRHNKKSCKEPLF